MKAREVELLCTLGPASLNDHVIHWLERAGTSLLRLNLSHTKVEDLERIITFVQQRTSVPLCLDTEGAQVRTGPLADGKVTVRENRFLTAYALPVAGDQFSISLYPAYIINKLELGDFVSIDFNAVLAQVVEKRNDEVILRILNGGEIGQNKAVTVQRPLDMPPLTGKDISAIAIGRRMGIRHFALSFAHRASDINVIRSHTGDNATIISKIECLSGLRNLAAIAEKSDAILIDRGDLSREVPIEQIPAIQKMIIHGAKAHGAKVYVATNLLESMTSAPTPTRAEVNDIYNTLADGADGLVLAAETAIGLYPVNCARMVVKVAQQFQRSNGTRQIRVRPSSLMAGVEPHGGRLLCQAAGLAEIPDIQDLPAITVGDEELTDVEQIVRGTFSPLRGFMDRTCLESVLEDKRLPSGLIWTMPVVLAVPDKAAIRFSKGDRVLLSTKCGSPHSLLEVSEAYDFEPELLARKWFGTDSRKHPGAARVLARGGHFLAGNVTLIQPLPLPYRRYDLTPSQLRTVFAHKGWSRVVAFHTRNLVHRGHERIQIEALERTYADGLLINPIVGHARRGDFLPHLILDGYRAMLDYGIYPPGKVVLASFITYPRFAGPREAVFTALCRKNMGCSHFIIGRDHSGVGGFYGPNASRELFEELGELGIEPIFFDPVGYDTQSERYVDLNACRTAKPISGTEIRRALMAGEALPNWMMRSEVQDVVRAELMMKHALFQE
ncbi:sulfate adenylyltransferase [Rhizobium sp. ARZ01]|uniref:pyruvate kinase n=1 Tax=Rhizobium sp. ARZ01 TaxID=2769313 RepID=UPI00178139CB|nr:pyruvate kinase [Rhizobium sp. ARZ01]MBD9373696.1 sulfate adenylyltransferase [Rhizobium sp. ARZ01]